jgi:iron complex transport system substrate-binding protein
MKIIQVIIFPSLLILFLSFPSCQNLKPDKRKQRSENRSIQPDSISKIIYAKGFDITFIGNVKALTIYEPGKKKKVRETIYILDGGKYIDTVARTRQFQSPIDSVAVFSATQLNALDKLGLLDKVIGVSEANYIRNKQVQERFQQGLVTELAGNGSFYVEKTLQVNPSVIFFSPYNSNESHPLTSTKIPMISFLDFMEDSPLGRAEWIKFTAVFFGKEKLADSLFSIIENEYINYKEIASKATTKPSVFSDKFFNGQWFVPGGQSYIAKLFEDANADYVWKDNPQSGSIPLDFEAVFNEAGKADFWRIIGSYNEKPGYENLAQENVLYTHFKAFREHHVIYCDAEKSGYFEKSPLEPQTALADLIKAFHPELLAGYQPVYYKVIP